MPSTTSQTEVAPYEGETPALGGEPAARPAQGPVEIQTDSPAERRVKMLNLGAVIVPLVGLAAAIVLAWGRAFNWTQFGIFLGMVTATSLGVTLGFHRLFTHRAFATTRPIKYLLGAMGSMSVQGTVIEWSAIHRRHHQHSDEPNDPHSPHVHGVEPWGDGFRAILRGFYHSHMGWLWAGRPKGMGKYVRDLNADPVTAAVNRHFRYWVYAGLLIPTILGGLLEGSLYGALLGLLWGGLVRIVFVHHVTWSVNSVCHLWGTSPFRTGDHSRNNPIVAVLTLGEGWHNNHHAFPNSARHGLRWWELDICYMVIRGLGLFGLARDIRLPDPERVGPKRRV